ncbi:LysR substrate-binding domain-containing protein [Komagataeibacter sp. FNDCF1]|uniref:LysR substrate-binding domain-containing protein n=1 Tax=Komagataeibacter sp. FNDCF1 TaxID=2878681 RepID=UPI001E64E373|nr:LysR substrate-binding domain-containing protein [Komagataeibacter sp. FNDCF1]MCE2563264.1 LysR family transcriptional regulator [Komagataeibacter sp. FNDCF1]
MRGRTALSSDHLLARLAFRHLRMVMAIAGTGSLAAAARQLNMTQSAVTKSLQETETLFGTRLFERTPQGAIPTAQGQVLLGHARVMMDLFIQAADEVSAPPAGGGQVRVGTLQSASAALLPRAITMLRREHPDISVSVIEGTNDMLMPAMLRGEIDLVVGRIPAMRQHDHLADEILMHDVACIVAHARHPLTRSPSLSLRDLAHRAWILPPQGTTLRQQIDQAFRDEGIAPPRGAVESVSLLTNRGLLDMDDYLAAMPWQSAVIEVQESRMAVLPIPLRSTISPIGITTGVNGSRTAAALHMIMALRHEAGNVPECPFLDDPAHTTPPP